MKITKPNTAAAYFRTVVKNNGQEQLWVLALTSGKEIIASKMIFQGTVNYCLVHMRDIWRYAIMQNAVALIVCHNHPQSGSTPSHEDDLMTTQMVEVGEFMQIPVVDHIILGDNGFYSYMEAGLMKPVQP